jgi:hypothetical protein
MQRWRVLLIILLVLLISVIGFEFWLLKQPLNNKAAQTNTNSKEPETKVSCEWKGKIYKTEEQFWIRLSDGCSLCVCGENSSITCQKLDCPRIEAKAHRSWSSSRLAGLRKPKLNPFSSNAICRLRADSYSVSSSSIFSAAWVNKRETDDWR